MLKCFLYLILSDTTRLFRDFIRRLLLLMKMVTERVKICFAFRMRKHMNLSVPVSMPEDIANILLFLASDESRAITGQVIVSDFGATL